MNWDYADPFVIDLRVLAEDIDGLGHANNAVYVSWLERCAWRHSQRLGLDLAEYRRLDRAMAVLRHEIDYLAAAYEGDELQLATWIVESDQRLRMNRRFQLVRPADGARCCGRRPPSSASNCPAASRSGCRRSSSTATARLCSPGPDPSRVDRQAFALCSGRRIL